eukprot:scaffold952_cov409-Prasinococcus_capsulatus_cf.AAC.15
MASTLNSSPSKDCLHTCPKVVTHSPARGASSTGLAAAASSLPPSFRLSGWLSDALFEFTVQALKWHQGAQ